MTQWRKPARLALAVVVFAVAGPPVGGLVAWLSMGALSLRSPLPFIAASWSEGGALALMTGIATALAACRGVTSWIVPVAAATLVTALFIAVTAASDRAAMLRTAPALMPPAIAAAITCWLLTRRLLGAPGAARPAED